MNAGTADRPDRLSSVNALDRCERARLAERPDWQPVISRTEASCRDLLDELDATVTRMLGEGES